MKILLAVDGSSYTQKMLAYLTAHTKLFSAHCDYTVLTVHPAVPPRARVAVDKAALDSYYIDETATVMTPITAFLESHGIKATNEWQVGPAGKTIAKFADDGGFDLLIMGSHGHGALANLVMGSVVTQVLANSTVPVLLVR